MTTLLRELGVRLVIHIDDILIMAENQEVMRDHTLGLIYLLENLGFIVHPEKTLTYPTQETEFLGMWETRKQWSCKFRAETEKDSRTGCQYAHPVSSTHCAVLGNKL